MSLRNDVSADPGQLAAVPDYDHLGRYFAPGFDSSLADLEQVEALYSAASRNVRRRPDTIAYVATTLLMTVVLIGTCASLARNVTARLRLRRATPDKQTV
jgi:hypothetical protein